MVSWLYWFRDDYRHYRRHVGLGRIGAFYRALYYRTFKKDPAKYRMSHPIEYKEPDI